MTSKDSMNVLDRDAFAKTISVSSLRIKSKVIDEVQKVLKRYLWRVPNLRPIIGAADFSETVKFVEPVDTSADDIKYCLLDPKAVRAYDDIDEADQTALEKAGIQQRDFLALLVTLTYENMKVDEILEQILPPGKEVCSGYTEMGHLVHVNLREHQLPYKYLIGQVFLDKLARCKTVVNKVGEIDTTYRTINLELLAGEDNMIVTMKEHGCRFEFDFAKVFWNSRLSTEHQRIVKKFTSKSVVYDVFAGVGPFAIPAAKKGCRVLANDLNPDSIKWMVHNVQLNKIRGNLVPLNKDGAEFIKEDIKNDIVNDLRSREDTLTDGYHVIMNLPGTSVEFLPNFRGLLKDEKDWISEVDESLLPTLHVYAFAPADGAIKHALQEIERRLGAPIPRENILEELFVRNVSPNKEEVRISLRIPRTVLLNNDTEEISEPKAKRLCSDL